MNTTVISNKGAASVYRADIDGLRAIAVLSVVGFHAFPRELTGGFVGVDIFFVISGYLITSIILGNLVKNDRFSIFEFYSRRIRRIFPALVLVMTSSLVIGWFTLLTAEYAQLGKHIAGGATFLSNFVLWKESGYFDNVAETKPMLHLWSLAIEEQFYIFWPLILTVMWRLKRNVLGITFAILILSFGANLYLIFRNPSAAFYFPVPRFWELMLGGTLAYISLHRPTLLGRHQEMQSVLGLALVAFSLLWIDNKLSFPSWWALAPTIGAMLLISAGKETWINRTLLSNSLMVFVGLISYPIYLWHWIFLSFPKILTPSLEPSVTAGAVVISFLLGWMTYQYVERPIRTNKRELLVVASLVTSMAVLFAAGIVTYANKGIPKREVVQSNHNPASGFDGGVSGIPVSYDCSTDAEQGLKIETYCVRDTRQPARYAVIGDSKAGALIGGLIRTSTDRGRWILIGGNAMYGAPVPVLSEHEAYKRNQHLAANTLKLLGNSAQIEVVVFAMATRTLFNLKTDYSIEDLPGSPYYEPAYEGLLRGTRKILDSGKKVVLVVDNPTLPHPEYCMERTASANWINKVLSLDERNKRCAISLTKHYELARQYNKLLSAIRQMAPDRVFVFDTIPYLCEMEKGECATFRNNRFLYGVTDHISDYASGVIGAALNRFIATIS